MYRAHIILYHDIWEKRNKHKTYASAHTTFCARGNEFLGVEVWGCTLALCSGKPGQCQESSHCYSCMYYSLSSWPIQVISLI